MTRLPHPDVLGPPGRPAMALAPLGAAPRIIIDDEYERETGLRRALWQAHGTDVFAGLPLSNPAQTEAADLIADDTGLARGSFLDMCLSVQEDLLLLAQGGGAFKLVAGGLFFPSLWRLQDKLGLPLGDVHGPVPHYHALLAGKVDRLLMRMQPAAPMVRYNWTIHNNPALYHPDPINSAEDQAAPIGTRLWLRSERQTLTKLPQTGAILFTIKTVRQRLDEAVDAQPEWARFLAKALHTYDAAMLDYKSLGPHKTALLDWFKQVAS